MPLNGLTHDNLIGREKVHVREASKTTNSLASFGRCCWKQVRLGHGSPELQQKGLTGNTIFLPQPCVSLSSADLELPPREDALVDTISIAFTRSGARLSQARWAQVNRAAYVKLVRRRQQECSAYQHAKICGAEASTRLPEDGLRDTLANCLRELEGLEEAPV